MDIELIRKNLAETAEEGYENVEKSVMEAVQLCDAETLVDNARRLVAAADVRAVLTGPISDDLASQISLYGEPFSVLYDRLYMARDEYKESYLRDLENEIDSLIDPVNELGDSPELFGIESAGQITGQRM